MTQAVLNLDEQTAKRKVRIHTFIPGIVQSQCMQIIFPICWKEDYQLNRVKNIEHDTRACAN